MLLRKSSRYDCVSHPPDFFLCVTVRPRINSERVEVNNACCRDCGVVPEAPNIGQMERQPDELRSHARTKVCMKDVIRSLEVTVHVV